MSWAYADLFSGVQRRIRRNREQEHGNNSESNKNSRHTRLHLEIFRNELFFFESSFLFLGNFRKKNVAHAAYTSTH